MLVRFSYLKENGIVHDRMALQRAYKNGFPQPIQLGENTIAWRLSEVEAWVASRQRKAAIEECSARWREAGREVCVVQVPSFD
jgi:hypothetical protein